MNAPALGLRCYLVEWYRPEISEDTLDGLVTLLDERVSAICADGALVQLLVALLVPDDQLMFGVFAADSSDVVAQVCTAAGLPAQRLSRAIGVSAARQP
jgi:hypothetical protein